MLKKYDAEKKTAAQQSFWLEVLKCVYVREREIESKKLGGVHLFGFPLSSLYDNSFVILRCRKKSWFRSFAIAGVFLFFSIFFLSPVIPKKKKKNMNIFIFYFVLFFCLFMSLLFVMEAVLVFICLSLSVCVCVFLLVYLEINYHHYLCWMSICP